MHNCFACCPAALGLLAFVMGMLGAGVRLLDRTDGMEELIAIEPLFYYAYVFQIVAWITAGLLIVALFVAACVALSPRIYMFIGSVFILVCALFQGLVLIVFQTNYCETFVKLASYEYVDQAARYCPWGTGSITALIACIMYVIAGLLSCTAARCGRRKKTSDIANTSTSDLKEDKATNAFMDEGYDNPPPV